MEKVLNQAEIDAMVARARGGQGADQGPQKPRIELWDARRSGQIGRQQLQAITLLHEGFARSLTHSLGAYLRIVFSATLVSAENLAYREFLQRIPETTYLASCRLEPMGVSGALQLDLKVAFPIIDLLLGGEGRSIKTVREITDIEQQILEGVARIICRELGLAWQAVSLEVGFERRLEAAEAQQLISPEEKTLSLAFEITMPDVRGGLNLAVPAAVSNALLRKISASWSYRQPRGQAGARRRLMARLEHCPFEAELAAEKVRAAVGALSELAPGSLLRFARRSSEPCSLIIAGVGMFQAQPARRGSSRLATLQDRTVELPEDQKRANL